MKLVFVLVAMMVAQAYCNPSKPLLLSVYYESKCPDSRNFIVDQLVSAVSALQDHMQLQLVPFGKAKNIDNGNGGFKCQHGPSECRGNMVQDCALNLMEKAKKTDVEKVKYVTCEMQSLAGTTGDLKCVREAGLQEDEVQKCMNSDLGIQLQLESERLTNRIKPKFVPSITINGRFDQTFQDNGIAHLVTSLCNLIPNARSCATRPPRNTIHF